MREGKVVYFVVNWYIVDGIGKFYNGFFNVDVFDYFGDVVYYVNIKL